MTGKARNQEINRQLDELYQSATEEFLWEYRRAFPNDPAPPSRLNRFGIIDTQRYDAASGLLIICQETRGWDNRDFGEDRLLRECLGAIAREGLFPEARPLKETSPGGPGRRDRSFRPWARLPLPISTRSAGGAPPGGRIGS